MLKIIDYKKGMRIKKPCIIRDMPNEVYHKMPALSSSGLKTLLDCPAKYYYKYLSGEYIQKEKPSFKIGKACHCYLLEGKEKFEQIYWHNPYCELSKDELIKILFEKCRLLFSDDLKYLPKRGRSKIFNYIKLKRKILELGEKYNRNTIKQYLVSDLLNLLLIVDGITSRQIHLSASELNQIICMARAAITDKKAKNALSQKGESELSIFWQDEETEVWLKCRPDFLPYDCLNVPDYKTADSANPRIFLSKFIQYGYHVQAAMNQMGIKAVTGIEVENFYFIVQEKEAPYITQIYNPHQTYMLYGEKAVRSGIKKYLECKEKGIWDTYCDKIIELKIDSPPEELGGYYDKENGICYAPYWIDKEFERYEV